MGSKKKAVEEAEVIETEAVETETTEETGTELVESEGTEMVTDADEASFLEEADASEDEDYGGVDRLVIDQKGETEGAVKGEFFCKNTSESLEGFPAVVLKKSKSRIMWPKVYREDNKCLCKSDDGITPVTDDDDFEPKAASCKKCPYGQWKRTKEEGNIPPACAEVTDMILLNLDNFMPYIYSVKSTALGATNQGLLKIVNRRKRALTIQRKRAGLPPAHICMYSFVLGTELKKNPSGSAYIPVYSEIEELDDAQKDAMVAAAMEVRDIDIHYRNNDNDGYSSDDSGKGEDRTDSGSAFDEIPDDETDWF